MNDESDKIDDESAERAYQRLRPSTQIEGCECAHVAGIFLVDILTDNPIHCDFCRKEVDPERLALTAKEVDAVAVWFQMEQALYHLWLGSGEYQEYAKQKLLDPNGQVNGDGLALAELLSERIPTRLWLFRDTDKSESANCPICNAALDLNVKWGHGKCDHCRIQV